MCSCEIRYRKDRKEGDHGSGDGAFAAADLEGVLAQGGHSEQQRKDALGSIQKLLGPTGSLELRAYIQVTRKPSTHHRHMTSQKVPNAQ